MVDLYVVILLLMLLCKNSYFGRLELLVVEDEYSFWRTGGYGPTSVKGRCRPSSDDRVSQQGLLYDR